MEKTIESEGKKEIRSKKLKKKIWYILRIILIQMFATNTGQWERDMQEKKKNTKSGFSILG